MKNFTYTFDLPAGTKLGQEIAIDTETMGLKLIRDRLCAVQIADKNSSYVVHFPEPNYEAPNLKKLLSNPDVHKIFHFARFDIAALKHYLEVDISNIFCTKIASKLVRTYTDYHGLKELCRELLGVNLSKQQQSSYWGAAELSAMQVEYAASDVIYLHDIKAKLSDMLKRENRLELAYKLFSALPAIAELDLLGWEHIFEH